VLVAAGAWGAVPVSARKLDALAQLEAASKELVPKLLDQLRLVAEGGPEARDRIQVECPHCRKHSWQPLVPRTRDIAEAIKLLVDYTAGKPSMRKEAPKREKVEALDLASMSDAELEALANS
jgi:hypothetical protein